MGALLGLALIVCLVIGGMGYRRYRMAVSAMPLPEAVISITSREDYVPFEEISPLFVQALTSVEDRRFFTRTGIDIIAMGRAVAVNLYYGKIIEGGSTIGQQVAKNLYFTHTPSITRKVAEVLIMLELERLCSKEEIFALYANIIYYGDGYHGIHAASHGYFNKEPSELSLPEASLLAGLPQSPSRYQLSSGSALAITRQSQVLQAMVECGFIESQTKEEALQWSKSTFLEEIE